MTRVPISARVAYEKNYLRPLILFLIEKRQSVIGDSDFIFSDDEYSEFAKNNFKYPVYLDVPFSAKHNLKLLEKFKRRDDNFKIIHPEQPLLTCKKDKEGHLIVSNCFTEYLTSTLRFIEISLHLDENGKPLEKNKSFFGMNEHQNITFMDVAFRINLGPKEVAIFNYLRKNFNKECGYSEIFKAVEVYKKDDPRVKKMLEKERAGYIRDGIDEIREKLHKVSGYPSAVETMSGRGSIFKLVY